MSTWGELRKMFLIGSGEKAHAEQQAWTFLTEGYRMLCNRIEVPELDVPDATVALALGDDSFEMDCDAFTIRSMFNVTDGVPMYREPGGYNGRQRFLEQTTGKPPQGSPEHYVRTGNKIWVRDTADAAKTLKIHYKIQPPDVAAANINDHPVTPSHYDTAIVQAAIYKFFTTYTQLNKAEEGQPLPSQVAKEAFDAALAEQVSEVEVETRNEHSTVRIAGFRYAPRSRRPGGRRRR